MTKAIVFDMDGVLIDSEYTYLESKTSILHDAGFTKPVSYQYQFMGTTSEFMWTKMKEELKLPKSVSFYINEMNHRRQKMIKNDGIRPIKGAVELVERLHIAGVPLAVASSSPKKEILYALTELGIEKCFDTLVSGEEVEHSKPEPDVYLEAARQLNVLPTDCVAFEDTKNGVLSAKTAQMYVIGFANKDYPTQNLTVADRIIDKYDSLSVNYLLDRI